MAAWTLLILALVWALVVLIRRALHRRRMPRSMTMGEWQRALGALAPPPHETDKPLDDDDRSA